MSQTLTSEDLIAAFSPDNSPEIQQKGDIIIAFAFISKPTSGRAYSRKTHTYREGICDIPVWLFFAPAMFE